uniref:Uncharacterized protein n=1 Tax=Globodera rostochiensis TaxID=31243 RepID=A0A914H070_GLORO
MNAMILFGFILLLINVIFNNNKQQPFLLYVNGLNEFNIGTLYTQGSQQWQNLRHAIDEWNGQHSPIYGFYLSLISPSDASASIDIRFCDIAQRHLVAMFLTVDSAVGAELAEFRIALSMCKRLRIPCLLDGLPASIKKNRFLTNVGPTPQMLGQALAQLIVQMTWSSFILLYKHSHASPFAAPFCLAALQHRHARVLPHTNILLYTDDLGTIHSLLVQAAKMNMSETRYSYLVANMDLHLLEDFLGPEFHCNITGFQLVRQQPQIKTDLALAMDAMALVGAAVHALRQRNLEPKPQQLLCDAGDQWTDGMLVEEQIRKVELSDATTGGRPAQIRLNATTGERIDTSLGKWEKSAHRWAFNGNHDERNKWRFRVGPNGTPDLRGERLKVVVYLEEPFVMRKMEPFSSASSSLSSPSSFIGRIRSQPSAKINQNQLNRDEHQQQQFEGFCIDLLKEMAKLLNFTYDIEVVDDGTYGVEDEYGRWNGIIGVLQRHEADLSVSAVTITYSRVSVIDFTLPFMHLGIAILMRRNVADETERSGGTATGGSNLFTFMEPLSFSVWIALAIAYASVAGTMWILAKCSPYEWYEDVTRRDKRRRSWRRDGSRRNEPPKDSRGSVSGIGQEKAFIGTIHHKNQFNILNSLWFAVGSLMQQGSDVIPRAAATRTVAVIWWLFTLILISSYTAQLAAFLTVERMSTPVESSADLAAQQRIKFGTLSNGSTMEFFRESRIPIYERMWSIMQSTTPTVFVNSSREGIARVKAGNYAYMMESTMLEYWIGEDCQLQTIGGLLDSKGYGIALPKGSPLRDIFSRAVLQLQERTIVEALKNKWWKSQHRPRTETSAHFGASPAGACPPGGHSHSSLYRVFGIFYVLFAAILVGLLLAISEFCIESRRRQSLRLGLCLPGRIFGWAIAWKGEEEDTVAEETVAQSKLKGSSQLYLDTVDQIRDGSGSVGHIWPCAGGSQPDVTGPASCSSADYDRVSFSLLNEDHGRSSQFVVASAATCTAPAPLPASSAAGGGPSLSSLDEMDDFITSLRSTHSARQQQKGRQRQDLLNCSNLTGSVDTRRRSPPVRQRQMSVPCDEEDQQKHGESLTVPRPPNQRKVSEPNAAGHKRKNSIRGVLSKLSTPSIVIGADQQDFHALQHLIPLTDERLLTRRQSSSQPDLEDDSPK